jgi:hypothetical protein
MGRLRYTGTKIWAKTLETRAHYVSVGVDQKLRFQGILQVMMI